MSAIAVNPTTTFAAMTTIFIRALKLMTAVAGAVPEKT